jgi:hypothetical protein
VTEHESVCAREGGGDSGQATNPAPQGRGTVTAVNAPRHQTQPRVRARRTRQLRCCLADSPPNTVDDHVSVADVTPTPPACAGPAVVDLDRGRRSAARPGLATALQLVQRPGARRKRRRRARRHSGDPKRAQQHDIGQRTVSAAGDLPNHSHPPRWPEIELHGSAGRWWQQWDRPAAAPT